MQEKSEIAECTFRPKISRNSERAIREIRGNLREDVSDRLYKSSSIYAEQRFRLIEGVYTYIKYVCVLMIHSL